jgi:hypothetical protein
MDDEHPHITAALLREDQVRWEAAYPSRSGSRIHYPMVLDPSLRDPADTLLESEHAALDDTTLE